MAEVVVFSSLVLVDVSVDCVYVCVRERERESCVGEKVRGQMEKTGKVVDDSGGFVGEEWEIVARFSGTTSDGKKNRVWMGVCK